MSHILNVLLGESSIKYFNTYDFHFLLGYLESKQVLSCFKL
jgi:hypothetical protein